VLGADFAGEHRPGGHPDPEVHDGEPAQRDGQRASGGQRIGFRLRGGQRRAEHGQHRVTLELVDQALPFVDGGHHDLEETVEHFGDLGRRPALGQLGGPDEIHVEHRGVADLTGQRAGLGQGAACDMGSDVAAEDVAEPVSFGQPGDHPVETALQTADLGTLVDVDLGVDLTVLDLGHGVDDVAHRVGDRHGDDHHPAQADQDRDQREDDNRYLDVGGLLDDPAVRVHDHDHRDTDGRQCAAHQPHQQQPGHHARRRVPPGDACRRRGGDRTHRALDQQQRRAHGCRGAKEHGDPDQPGRHGAPVAVDDEQHHPADRPDRCQHGRLVPQ
jgi:hypothetical protein